MLAFGAVATWAGYVGIGLALALSNNTFWDTLPILALALLAALFVGIAIGGLIGRHIVVPVMGAPTLSALVATVGLAIALEEAMRLSVDSEDFWLQPLYAETLVEIGRPDYPIPITLMQVAVLAVSLIIA